MEMWMTIGEYFREKGMDFPMASFKEYLRQMRPGHLEGSWPYKYRLEDLEMAYQTMCEKSRYMRRRLLR